MICLYIHDLFSQLDDEEERETDKLVESLRAAADIIEAQRANRDPRFINNAKRVMRPTVNWVQDVQRHERHLTMPKTNDNDRGQPRPANVIGYLYQTH